MSLKHRCFRHCVRLFWSEGAQLGGRARQVEARKVCGPASRHDVGARLVGRPWAGGDVVGSSMVRAALGGRVASWSSTGRAALGGRVTLWSSTGRAALGGRVMSGARLVERGSTGRCLGGRVGRQRRHVVKLVWSSGPGGRVTTWRVLGSPPGARLVERCWGKLETQTTVGPVWKVGEDDELE